MQVASVDGVLELATEAAVGLWVRKCVVFWDMMPCGGLTLVALCRKKTNGHIRFVSRQ